MFGFGTRMRSYTTENGIGRLKEELQGADAIVAGAGAGLSTSAGFEYTGERFDKYFGDFAGEYGFRDMYSGGFYPYGTLEENWAYWSRYIYINRYMNPPKDVYGRLYALLKDKDYFVITTNVDHLFQKAGFDKGRLFYTQGDYGLWQCSEPCHEETYDNFDTVREMVLSQGFDINEAEELTPPCSGDGSTDFSRLKRIVPTELVPRCPVCGKPMSMNLRADSTFVENEGWHEAAERYSEFLRRHENLHILFLDLGCGMNTPGIFKYPFWQMTAREEKSVYACINKGAAFAPKEIEKRSICIDDDIGEVLKKLL